MSDLEWTGVTAADLMRAAPPAMIFTAGAAFRSAVKIDLAAGT